MRRSVLLTGLMMGSGLAHASPPPLPPGLWDVVSEKQESGANPLPGQFQFAVSPALQNRLRTALNSNRLPADASRRRLCLSGERGWRSLVLLDDRDTGPCTVNPAEARTGLAVSVACQGGSQTSRTGTLRLRQSAPDRLSGNGTYQVTVGDTVTQVHVIFEAQRVAPGCQR